MDGSVFHAMELWPKCMISHFYGWVSFPCYGIETYMYDFMFLWMGQFSMLWNCDLNVWYHISMDGSVFHAMELWPTCMISCFYGWVSFPCYGIVTYMYDFMFLWMGQFSMLWNCDLNVWYHISMDGSVFHAMELWPTCMISCFYGWVSFPCYGIVT